MVKIDSNNGQKGWGVRGLGLGAEILEGLVADCASASLGGVAGLVGEVGGHL